MNTSLYRLVLFIFNTIINISCNNNQLVFAAVCSPFSELLDFHKKTNMHRFCHHTVAAAMPTLITKIPSITSMSTKPILMKHSIDFHSFSLHLCLPLLQPLEN